MSRCTQCNTISRFPVIIPFYLMQTHICKEDYFMQTIFIKALDKEKIKETMPTYLFASILLMSGAPWLDRTVTPGSDWRGHFRSIPRSARPALPSLHQTAPLCCPWYGFSLMQSWPLYKVMFFRCNDFIFFYTRLGYGVLYVVLLSTELVKNKSRTFWNLCSYSPVQPNINYL